MVMVPPPGLCIKQSSRVCFATALDRWRKSAGFCVIPGKEHGIRTQLTPLFGPRAPGPAQTPFAFPDESVPGRLIHLLSGSHSFSLGTSYEEHNSYLSNGNTFLHCPLAISFSPRRQTTLKASIFRKHCRSGIARRQSALLMLCARQDCSEMEFSILMHDRQAPLAIMTLKQCGRRHSVSI